MGRLFDAVCQSCQHQFTANEGGGFQFELLRCGPCGTSKGVPYRTIWNSYLAYLKGRKTRMPEPNGVE
ncbi:MAG: hypothetical protein K2R98_24350 [Gemmataceae bacterium]|nr:hypothetical protein [Gemmataceae bacterium]